MTTSKRLYQDSDSHVETIRFLDAIGRANDVLQVHYDFPVALLVQGSPHGGYEAVFVAAPPELQGECPVILRKLGATWQEAIDEALWAALTL